MGSSCGLESGSVLEPEDPYIALEGTRFSLVDGDLTYRGHAHSYDGVPTAMWAVDYRSCIVEFETWSYYVYVPMSRGSSIMTRTAFGQRGKIIHVWVDERDKLIQIYRQRGEAREIFSHFYRGNKLTLGCRPAISETGDLRERQVGKCFLSSNVRRRKELDLHLFLPPPLVAIVAGYAQSSL